MAINERSEIIKAVVAHLRKTATRIDSPFQEIGKEIKELKDKLKKLDDKIKKIEDKK